MPSTSVSEIHAYPLRPEGFLEPLFPTPESRQEIAEHLLKAPWLSRASEMRSSPGESAHALREPVELNPVGERVELVRVSNGRKRARRRQWVVEVLDRWREVREWWDEVNHVDRLLFRVVLSGGPVVNLARERSGEWFLVGVMD